MTEREMALQLFSACRRLLRYDGIDQKRVRTAVDEIQEIISEWLELEQSGELDCE